MTATKQLDRVIAASPAVETLREKIGEMRRAEGVIVAMAPGEHQTMAFERVCCPGCQHAADLEARVAELERCLSLQERLYEVKIKALELSVAKLDGLEAAYERLREYVQFRAELAP